MQKIDVRHDAGEAPAANEPQGTSRFFGEREFGACNRFFAKRIRPNPLPWSLNGPTDLLDLQHGVGTYWIQLDASCFRCGALIHDRRWH